MYGMPDGSEIKYRPYNALVPDSDKTTARYPVSFEKPSVKDGCICYAVADGIGGAGLKFAMAT
jgi:hypothetical protein